MSLAGAGGAEVAGAAVRLMTWRETTARASTARANSTAANAPSRGKRPRRVQLMGFGLSIRHSQFSSIVSRQSVGGQLLVLVVNGSVVSGRSSLVRYRWSVVGGWL